MISWTASKSKPQVVGLVGCGRMGRCMLESVLNAGFRAVACEAFPAAAAADGVVYENHSASEPLVVLRHFAENPELPAR